MAPGSDIPLLSHNLNYQNMSISRIKHHPQYYLRDGSVSFHARLPFLVVAGTLFRVHKYFFERESEYFREGFEEAGPQEDGHSDQAAFRLDDVKISEFERLLWVFYNPQYMYDEQPKDHWTTILDLATRWRFPSVVDLAVRQLQKLDMKPVERIVTYDKYNLDKSLLLPAYILLCKQSSRSVEDGEQLGMPTVLRINEAREYAQRFAAEQGCSSPTSADAEDEELVEILRGVFGLSSDSQAT
ncbi:hypothetical protein DEU56DRAFT_735645 [Suillus clintonianus]|uniref:uncharacterized protein n=1 Tax=Suillus clintonianus TaxID=1904413 RepID=UPI001B870302|nr:uncharacterized protein DEU56DRAFT_735645 [Suillus clintonianus]KAG2139233.1 hypothetical protein DEU56DRAFT_735645 [Suillus clintonianus]